METATINFIAVICFRIKILPPIFTCLFTLSIRNSTFAVKNAIVTDEMNAFTNNRENKVRHIHVVIGRLAIRVANVP